MLRRLCAGLLLLVAVVGDVGKAHSSRAAGIRAPLHAPAQPLDALPHLFGFVCGVHFSGTSVLHYALGLHPEVSIMRVAPKRQDEGQILQDVMPTAQEIGEAYLGRVGDQASRAREAGRYFAVGASARLTEHSPLLTHDSARRLRAQWGFRWDTRKRVLVEKSPPDLVRMRFLAKVFPPAWFALILRHPLSVCRRVEWHMRLLCTHNWLNAYEWALEDVRAGNLTAYVTFYELWATQPVAEMRALSAIVGLDSPHFNWSSVIVEGADVGLKSHAETGWGYSGPRTAEGHVRQRIYVDPSRPLPTDGQSVNATYRNVTLRRLFTDLEPRLNAFGYSFMPPFTTGCALQLRRAAACPLQTTVQR